jgi:hypothetical protein
MYVCNFYRVDKRHALIRTFTYCNLNFIYWAKFRERPGQEYPKPANVYEELEGRGSERYKDRSKWKEVITAYPNGKQA